MTAHVALLEGVVLKRFSTETAATAANDRATALQAAGINTPHPTRTDGRTLRFPRICGTTGADLLKALPDLLAPLTRLNQLRLPCLDLPQHDPLRRIRPRLALAPDGVARLVEQQLGQLPAPTDALCHGDFHPGQVIRDASGQSWLLDLDDLAHGPAEADLGNLIAWLATRPLPSSQPLAERIRQSQAVVLTAWTAIGCRADHALLVPYTTLAVIRRALKRAERGDPSLVEEMALTAYRLDMPNFSIL